MIRFFKRIIAGCRNLLKRKRVEQELSDELAHAFESLVEGKMHEGASLAEARRLTAIELGGIEQLKEKVRDVKAGYALEGLLRDLRFGARMLVKTPGFTLIALATLALGIGANTAVFSAFNTLLLQPLPFESPNQLVRIYSTKNGAPIQGTGNPGGPSMLDVRDFAEGNHTFEKIVGYDTWRKNVSFANARGEPEQMRVGLVPADYFRVLRMQPIIGRLFTDEENQLGRHYVAAINERLWKERFARDPGVLGQKILINDEPHTIVAVMPDLIPEWMEPGRAGKVEIWTPFAPLRTESESSRAARGNAALGRLKPGVSLQQAQADLSQIAAALAATYPVDQDVGVALIKLADTRAGSLRPMVLLLVGAVGLVLLIACLNLANLLLARNAAREQEIAMRAALGAARRSLIRQLLVEAGLVSLIGAASGLVFAKITVSIVRNVYSATLPQLATMQIDWRVVTFTLLLCAITTLLFGLVPVIKATQFDLVEVLKHGSRTSTSSLSTKVLRNLLVVVEVAVSLMLVLVASLLIQTIARLEGQNLGIRQEHLLKAHFYMPPARYPDSAAITRFCDQFGERLRALASVTEASVTTVYPPTNGWVQMLELPQRPVNRVQDVASAQFGVTDSHFLTTLGVPLIRGRNFAESDTAMTQPVALVNEEFARRYFPNGDGVGQQTHIGPPKFLQIPTGAGTTDDVDVIIVGVIADFRNGGLAGSPQPQIIGLYSQHPIVNYGFKDLVVRTAAEPRVLSRTIADQLHSLDPDIPLAEVQTFDEIVERQVGDKRFTTFLLSAFASIGLVLAVVGIYGVASIFVSQRKRELAVRMALGASRGNAVSLVLRQAMFNAAIGTLLGLSGAWAAQQLIRGFLFQVSPVDPTTFAAGALFLLAVAILASLIPAARASGINPAQLLRQE
jgi:putative ABC transport system permease protein